MRLAALPFSGKRGAHLTFLYKFAKIIIYYVDGKEGSYGKAEEDARGGDRN